jgi:hypothetical protein
VLSVPSDLGGYQAASQIRGGSMVFVPTISGFFGIAIAMFFDDHGPPHFHAAVRTRLDRAAPMIGLTPAITEAAVIRYGVLHLRFADGLSGEVEVLAPDTLYERVRTGAWPDQGVAA